MPRAAARRSQVVPQSKQLGSQTRRCRAGKRLGKYPGEAMPRQPRRCAGRQAGAHRRGEDEPRSEVNGFPPHWKKALTVYPEGSKVPLQGR